MATAAVPNHGTMINPTGANGTGGTTPAWGGPVNAGTFTPPTGSPGNYGYGSSGNPNPISMNPNGMQTGGLSNSGTNWKPLTNELGKVYGEGVGSEVYGFLDSGGGYNSPLTQQAVEAQVAEMNKQAKTGYGNLKSGEGGAGISPNSSVAALEDSNYWSNVTTAENAMTAEEFFNMWNSSMNREASVLGDVMGASSQYKANQPTTMDYISEGLSLVGSGMDLFSGINNLPGVNLG